MSKTKRPVRTMPTCRRTSAIGLYCRRSSRHQFAVIDSAVADPSDAILKERVAAVKTDRDIAQVAFDRGVAELRPNARIT